MADVRVGIVSWNTASLLDRCLTALPAALGGVDAEVVVVDNGSVDDSVDVARRHAGVRVDAAGENLGYARAMNRALGGADAPVLVALNPDTEPVTGALARLVEILRTRPDVAIAVPRLVNVDGTPQHSVHRFPSLRAAAAVNLLPARLHRGAVGRRFLLEAAPPLRRAADVDWAVGAVHCIRASALAGGPPYRERWFVYVEDLDLCWRVRRAGWKVAYDPLAEVVHVGNASGEQAWGGGRARTERWLRATYDWFALERGSLPTRAWAALNLLGVLARGAGMAATRDAGARAMLRLAPLHAEALLRGRLDLPPPPRP